METRANAERLAPVETLRRHRSVWIAILFTLALVAYAIGCWLVITSGRINDVNWNKIARGMTETFWVARNP